MSSRFRTLAGKIPAPVRGRIMAPFYACRLFRSYFGRQTMAIFPTLMATGETHNFTYDITERNALYLAETVAVVTRTLPREMSLYIQEAIKDATLYQHLQSTMRIMGERLPRNLGCPFGRRLGWYAIARATKPNVVVETGVERGYGALLLCAALLRNAEEGSPGRYFGTDINAEAGWLLSGKYASVGKILYGDSIESLKALGETIDLFINDSDHSAEYEYGEYRAVAPKLSAEAIVLSDNAHTTDKLALFSRETGRRFLFFKEEPKNHWYPGAGIGISFR